ncbi:MAG: ABC transporter ATP-binding protein [Sulfitobacter sp. SK025]|uniref:ABC transporter ATP-binding protein n=1 Tax=Marivita sp. TaxID=2003365 RepID=UPI00122094FC|nr:ABC transporter ATP-binding protein [Marivita sp.]THF73535.1 MAG: ABC transporter ATP-binding protein [Sulfitobacter sp. SK025]
MILELANVTKRFGGLVALDDISFGVEEGSVTAVIGPNGAGKTTLFNLISGVFPTAEGEVRFHGEVLTGLAQHTIAARGLIRTFQLVKLFPNLTVVENVEVGRHLRTRGGLLSAILRTPSVMKMEADVRSRALELLDLVGLGDVASGQATSLPYGQQRLLEIARAMAAEPKILLLDEPAAGLNHEESATLGKLIRRIADQGVTVLMIEHDMKLVMTVAEKVVVLDFGVKLAEGGPNDIQRNPAVLAAYLGSPETEDA